MEKENTDFSTEMYTKDSGLMTKKKEEDHCTWILVISIKVVGRMARKMVSEGIHLRTEIIIKVNSSKE